MQDASTRMTQVFQQMLDDLEKRYITPQRKQSFLCAAACCDNAPNSRALQQCVQQCEQKPQRTAQLVDASLKEFQAGLESCGLSCLREYEQKLPKLRQDLEQQLKQAAR